MKTIILFIVVTILIFASGFVNRKDNPEKERHFLPRDYTNALRGLAIIMIMYGHICGRYNESVWFSPFACTGVAVFLLLSGYGNNESFFLKGSFPFSKLFKIAIPYWIVLFIISLINYNNIEIRSLIADIFFIKTSYWFVGYIFKWYFIFWLSVNYLYKYRWYIFVLAAFISFLFLSPLESEQSLSFICGIFISENKDRISLQKKSRIEWAAFVLFLLGTVALGIKQITFVRNHEFLFAVVQLLIKLPYALSIIIIMEKISFLKRNPLLLYLAPLTYELYLVHMQFLCYIDSSTNISTFCSTFFLLLCSVVLSLCLSKVNKIILSCL